MSPAPQAEITPTPASDVGLAAVEAELARLWRPRGGEHPEPPTRACMSNLIVFCASPDEAGRVDRELPEVVRVHPSRVLLLVVDPESGAGVSACVSAYCYLAGRGQRICSEHVVLRATPGSAKLLPSATRPLLIGDLPTALWWTPTDQAPPGHGRIFDELAAMAEHVIYDSRGWLDPVASMLTAADWAGREPPAAVASDLAWRRLEPWRRLTGEALDPDVAPGALDAICEVAVEHGPHAMPQAWSLVGWLARNLSWRLAGGKLVSASEARWRFDAPQGPVRASLRRRPEGEPDLFAVAVGLRAGREVVFERLERLGSDRIVRRPRAAAETPRVVSAPAPSRAAAVARELPYRAGHRSFRRALAGARAMAAALAP